MEQWCKQRELYGRREGQEEREGTGKSGRRGEREVKEREVKGSKRLTSHCKIICMLLLGN